LESDDVNDESRPRPKARHLAALAVMLSLAGAESASATQLGFTDDPLNIARAAPAVQGTSKVARIPVSWSTVRTHGWAVVDTAVNAVRASRQRIMLTVYGLGAPDLTQLRAFFVELNARYPDLWAVQAWNESNLDHIGGDLSVEETVAIVETARDALPGVRIIGPGVSPTVPGAKGYQRRLYKALPNQVGVGINVFTYSQKRLKKDLRAAYRRAKRDGGKAKVYVTEVGIHAGFFSNQARFSAKAFKLLRREGAAIVVFYRLLRNPNATAKWELEGRFNVLNDNLSPTPTFTALKRASR
jgi:hypothetical protein